MWTVLIPLYLGYQAIGAYVARSAFKNGYIRMKSVWEWMFAVSSWPWVLWHVRKVDKERSRLRPFEDYMDRYEQEQIDRRLDDID